MYLKATGTFFRHAFRLAFHHHHHHHHHLHIILLHPFSSSPFLFLLLLLLSSFASNAHRAMLSPTSPSSPADFFGLAALYLASICVVDLSSDSLRVPFLHTECLCWVILLALATLSQYSERFIHHDGDHKHADKLALAIAAACLCWTLGDARWAVVRSWPHLS